MENKIDEVSYSFATRENRLVHFVVDKLAYLVLSAIVIIPLFKAENPSVLLPLFALLIIIVLHFVYYTTLEYVFQRTIGKYLTGTIVVSNTGSKPTFKSVFFRSAGRLIPFVWIIVLIEDYSLHDKISNTRVIKYKS